jgi:hypothetical protein
VPLDLHPGLADLSCLYICVSVILSLPVGSCQPVNPTRLCDCRFFCPSDCLTLAVSQSFCDLLFVCLSGCLYVSVSHQSATASRSLAICLSAYLRQSVSQGVNYMLSVCGALIVSHQSVCRRLLVSLSCLRVSLSLQLSVCLPLQLLRPLVCCSVGLSRIW